MSLYGNLKEVPDKKIYLNINALEKGEYELNIVYKNKVVKTTTFTKK
ncbi:hypothetical protein EV197_2010 [Aquimarina brevivitae]|uniref:Uncharacterized protein n=1 Tax=Aquimarina brevivitae TaxID=323412 RepID=A0A4Q7P412_9FLAO|nr:hypothetical protein EV197_2010 [Aquimarina brevivitae]